MSKLPTPSNLFQAGRAAQNPPKDSWRTKLAAEQNKQQQANDEHPSSLVPAFQSSPKPAEPPAKRAKLSESQEELSGFPKSAGFGAPYSAGSGASAASPSPSAASPAAESLFTLTEGDLVNSVIRASHQESGDPATLVSLLATSFDRLLRDSADQYVYLSLMVVAKSSPEIFTRDQVWELLLTKLKAPGKKNSTTFILICNILNRAFQKTEGWPVEFVQCFLEDSFADRVWVDDELNRPFVENILTVFPRWMEETGAAAAQSAADPSKLELEPKPSSINRFPTDEVRAEVRAYVSEILAYHLSQPQRADKNILRVMLVTIGYPEVRHLAVAHIADWLNNTTLARNTKELLRRIALNCSETTSTELETVHQLLDMKVKPAYYPFHTECVAKVLQSNSLFALVGLKYQVENELLGQAKEINSKLLKIAIQSLSANKEAELAAILQDLAANSQSQPQVKRIALTMLRVGNLRPEFFGLCSALLKTEHDLDPSFLGAYIYTIIDLILLLCLHSAPLDIPSGKDRKQVYAWRHQVARIQAEALSWLVRVSPPLLQNDAMDTGAFDLAALTRRILLIDVNFSQFFEEKSEISKVADRCQLLPLEEEALVGLVLVARQQRGVMPSEAVEIASSLVARAAEFAFQSTPEERQEADPMKATNPQLVQAILQLSVVPTPIPAVAFASSELFWDALLSLVTLAAFNPVTLARAIWDTIPSGRLLIEMLVTRNFDFPPLVHSDTAKQLEILDKFEDEEEQLVFKLEVHQANAEGITPPADVTQCSTIGQYLKFDIHGPARRPPAPIVDRLRALESRFRLSHLFYTSKDSYFVLSLMKRQGTQQQLRWLWPIIKSDPDILNILPSHCLAQLLMAAIDESNTFPTEHTGKIISLLREGTAAANPATKTLAILDFFLNRLASPLAIERTLANAALFVFLVPTDHQQIPTASECVRGWFRHAALLPHHKLANQIIKDAIYSALAVETDLGVLFAYLSVLQEKSAAHKKPPFGLASELGKVLVRRPFVMTELFESNPEALKKVLRIFVDVFSAPPKDVTDKTTVTWAGTTRQPLVIGKSILLGALDLLSHPVADEVEEKTLQSELIQKLFTSEAGGFVLPSIPGESSSTLMPQTRAVRYIRSKTPALQAIGAQAMAGNDAGVLQLLTRPGALSPSTFGLLISLLDQNLAKNATITAEWIVQTVGRAEAENLALHLQSTSSVQQSKFTSFVIAHCLPVTVIINGSDYLGLLGSMLYYIITLKKYKNFNGQKNREQKVLVQCLILLKLLLSFLISFEWIFGRLNENAILDYPIYLVISDTFHLLAWLSVITVTYLEWNRSLPHSWFLRLYWALSAGTYSIKLYNLVRLAPEYGDRYEQQFIPTAALMSLHAFLAFLGLIGLIPKIREYTEPNIKLSFRKKGESEGSSEDPNKLFWKSVLTKEAAFWIIVGAILSCVRGYLLQEIYKRFGEVFDQADKATDPGPIIQSILTLVGIFFAYSGVFGASSFFWGIGAEKVANGANGIRNRLFANIMKQEVAYFNQTTTGAMVSRFSNDAERVKRLLTDFFPNVIEAIAMVLAGLIYLFTKSWNITLYLCTIVPLTYSITYYQAEIFAIFEERSQMRTARMTSKVQDVFSKYPTVLIYGTKNTEKRQMWKLVRHSYMVLRNKSIFAGFLLGITEFLSWCTTLLCIFLGVGLLAKYSHNSSNEAPLGVYVTFALYSINVIRGIIVLLKTLPRIGETVGSVQEVLRMLDRDPQGPEDPSGGGIGFLPDINVTHGDIEFKNCTFAYPTAPDKIALDNLNLKISRNSKVALVGDSGAGKSTILHLIARYYDCNQGQVLIDGQELKTHNSRSIRKSIATVSQDADIFALTILENILYGKHIDEEEGGLELIDEILSKLDAPQTMSKRAAAVYAEVLEAGEKASAMDFIQGQLGRKLGEGGKGLSGGQKQRLTIARALFKDPKILLLDEVTSALDSISEAVVQQAVDHLTQNRTVVIVAHRLHTIQNADKIVVLQGGKVVAEGQHDDLLTISPKYRELYEAAKQGSKKKVAEVAEPKEMPAEMITLLRRVKREISHNPALKEKFFTRIDEVAPQLAMKKPGEGEVSVSSLSKYARPDFGSVRNYFELLDDNGELDEEEGSMPIN